MNELNKLKIGNLELNSNIISAPMSEITDYSFRKMCREFGSALTFTEMVSAAGLAKGDFFALRIATVSEEEHPVALQLLGANPDILSEAANVAENNNIDMINLNFGCSADNVCALGFGAILLENPDKLRKIVNAVRKRVKKVPFTVKIRVGKDPKNISLPETLKIMEGEGVDGVIVHARTRNMEYGEPAKWEWITKAKEISKLPIIGNGDIFKREDAFRMMRETGCDGVMIARGSLGNPFIFKDDKKTLEDIFDAAIKHIKTLLRDKGEFHGVRTARKHLMWYFMNCDFIEEIRTRVYKIESKNELLEFLLELKNKYSNSQKYINSESTNFELFKKRILYWILEGDN